MIDIDNLTIMEGRSLIKLIDDQKTESGILVSHDTKGMTNIAEVVKVGPDKNGYLSIDGDELKEGDKVVIMPGRGEYFPIGEDMYVLIENNFILMKYSEE